MGFRWEPPVDSSSQCQNMQNWSLGKNLGGDLGGRCQTTWGSQRVWGLTVLEAGLDLSWETHAQICFHQFSLGVAKAFDASVFRFVRR